MAECLEQHSALVGECSKLIYSVFTTSSLSLTNLPELLKIAYQDDVFMAYETMNSVLGDLNKIDRERTKRALEESPLVQNALLDATDNGGDLALKLKTTNLLVEIWYLYPTIVS